MFHVASTEVRYSVKSLMAWFAVLLTMTLWPLLENPSVDGLSTVLAVTAISWPFVAVIGAFRLLSTERSERHLRLFRTLPLTKTQLAFARLLRTLALPMMVLGLSLALLATGVVIAGPGFLATFAGAWVLVTLFFLGIAVSILSTLLYDIGGMTFAQLFGAGLVLLVFLLNASGAAFGEAVLEPLTRFAQTPLGTLLAVTLCIVLTLCDVLMFRWRQDFIERT